jgi:hypothetical protein
MKTAIALLALTLGASIAAEGAASAQTDQTLSLTKASQGTDLSAAKKKKRRYPYGTYDQYGFYYPPAFAPGDPSWQSPELIRRRAIGQCVIDLGYGRYENCDGSRR